MKKNNVEYEFINTKNNPPNVKAIASWVAELGNKPMRNTSGKSYRALGDEKKSWDDQQWVEAFSKDAMLLKRPLFVKDDKAVLVGFRATEEEIPKKLDLV